MSSIINQEIYRRRENSDTNSSAVTTSRSCNSVDSVEKEVIWSTFGPSKESNIPERGTNLDSIAHFQTDQHFLLGSSVVNGAQGKGALHLYVGLDSLLENKQKTSIDIREGPINHIKILDKKFLEKAAVSYKSGVVCLFDSNLSVIKQNQVAKQAITSLASSADQSKLYCSSQDASINVIATENFTIERKYEYAHFQGVTGLDSWEREPHKLVSSGQDHLILIWDLRESRPSSKFTSINQAGTALKCSNSSDYLFILGTSGGDLIAYDIRQPQVELAARNLGIGPVYKIKAIEELSCVGIVGYSNKLILFKDSQLDAPVENLQCLDNQIVRDFIIVDKTAYCVGLNTNRIFSQKKDWITKAILERLDF